MRFGGLHMTMRRLLLLAGAGLLGMLALAAPALAAPTARASAALTIYAGPGYWYAPVGELAKNEVVSLAECTPRSSWCRIIHIGGRSGPDGWVLGSYLIGSAAKVEATPWHPLVDPFRFGPHRPRF